MQIKITVDIENTDILKFFELFKKDLATVAKNTTVETVTEKQQKVDCADFTGVQETEEKSESDNSTENTLEHESNFNAAPLAAKVEIVKNMLRSMAKSGLKDIAKNIMTKNKVPALSKVDEAKEKILVKMYNEIKSAQQ